MFKNDYKLNFYLAQEGNFAGAIFAVLERIGLDGEVKNSTYFVRDTFTRVIEWKPVDKKKIDELTDSNAQSISDIFKNAYDVKYLVNKKFTQKPEMIIGESSKGFKLTNQGYAEDSKTETRAILDVIPKEFTEGKNATYEDAHMAYLYRDMEKDLALEFRTFFLERTSGYEAEEAAELEYKNANTSLPEWLTK